MTRRRIAIATCLDQPDLQDSDRLFAAAAARRGGAVVAAPWNDDFTPFQEADAVIIRSTWDYQRAPARFAGWLERLKGRENVFNPPALMQWNMSKRYLLSLTPQAGVAPPPTRLAAPAAAAIAAAMDELSLDEAVVKPEIGATASGLSIVRRDDAAALAAAAQALAMPGLVQPLLKDIAAAGETSFVFIDGRFSHAVVKHPAAGDIRCQVEHGGRTRRASPPDWAIRAAARVLAGLPDPTLYARIDGVVLDGMMQLMEVELIEPELFFTYAPEAADRLAAALMERLQRKV